MRVMILGAAGMLGRDLVATAPSGVDVHALTHAELDITDAAALTSRVARLVPDLIVNAAAYRAVDQAESERDQCFLLNADAVGTLGEVAARAGARVVNFSSDYVFDGVSEPTYTEDSPTNPLNTYGASKAAGEIALTRSDPDCLIIRTQWLFGVHGRSFPRIMWERATKGAPTKVIADQTGRPTYSWDLAEATWDLALCGARGVVHATNGGTATWFDLASRVFARAGRSDLLAPCSTAEYPTPARRPPHSVLSTARLERLLGRELRPWQEALDDFLSQLGG